LAEQEFTYGGFWRRLAALGLDAIIFAVPVGLGILWAESLSRYFWLFILPANAAIGFFYWIYLVRRFGGTPGKLIMGLRVLKLDGGPVGYWEAILRALPDMIFAVVSDIGSIIAAFSMTNDAYLSLGWQDLQAVLDNAAPPWCHWIDIANYIWTSSEVIVLLTNRKRRALHDFLAGTIVVVVPKKPVVASPSLAET
jgi:uncharacterized RDD family membrane protein YckC